MKKLLVGVFILIGLAMVISARAADVGPYYWVLKKKSFDQTTSSAPSPNAAPFQLSSVVEKAPGGLLQSGSEITPPPNGLIHTARQYTVETDGSLRYEAFIGNGTQQELDNAFAPGSYHLELVGASVHYPVDLTLIGNVYPAEIPKLTNTNFKNGQLVVNALAPVTLTWNSFADHDSVDDVIIFTISDTAHTTTFRYILPPSATSKSFPANFLKPEKNYLAELNFVKVTNRTATIAGSLGLAGFAVTTKIALSTSSRTPVSGFANISTRGFVGTGENVLISGFIITSTNHTSKLRVVLRAVGPSLTAAGITSPLLDPTITLFDSQHHVIATNDNWQTTTGAAQITASQLAPDDSRESALLRDLPEGGYSAIVSGKNNLTGVGLAEVYNLGSDGDAKLANISTRAQVLTGEKVLIGGLIVVGPLPHKVIVRAIGPSLTGNGIAGALANPILELVNPQGNTIAINDNWKDTQQSDIEATHLAPTDDKESAAVITLGTGNYTAIVRGKNRGTGVALVEVYELN